MKKAIFYLILLATSLMVGCGCDSQSPDDVEQQFDADTINAPRASDSTISEKMYPMNTDSVKKDSARSEVK